MKNMFKYFFTILFIAVVLFTAGCNSPAPTELVQDNSSQQNPLQVEVVAKDTSDAYYGNGFDTTGVTGSITNYTNIINVSGIKVTRNSTTVKSAFAQAIFFDKAHPVHEPNGKLIGFRTITPGTVKFNNNDANKIPYHVAFNDLGRKVDSLLGYQYVLTDRLRNQFNYEYNSSVNFRYIPMHGPAVSFDIKTPEEITGQVTLYGKRANGTLQAELQWNKSDQKQIEIILGIIPKGLSEGIPLYRLTVNDNGRLNIPERLLNSIPKNKYDRIEFTFVRKYEKLYTEKDNNIYVLSQSIHSIIVDIP